LPARLLAVLLALVLVVGTVAACGGGSGDSGEGDTSGMTAGGDGGGDGGEGDGGEGDPEEPIEEEPTANNQVLLGAAFFGAQPAQFGAVALGESRRLGFEVRSLLHSRTILDVSIGGDHAGDFALDAGTCTEGAVVGEGASCTLTITFAPTQEGVRRAALDIEIDPGVSGGRSLEGTGGTAPSTTPAETDPAETAPGAGTEAAEPAETAPAP
jgi:hypothetical protein